MWMHTHSRSITLSPSLSHTQAEILYAFKSGLSILCVCVCVFTPLVIPVPMVSLALERRVISSFWGVAHWDPGGVLGRGDSKMRKKGELLEVLRAAHSCTSPRNSWLHMSGVPVLLSKMYPCSFLGSPPLSMLCFSLSVPFCLRLLSPAPAFVLLGSETTKWCCLPLLALAAASERGD